MEGFGKGNEVHHIGFDDDDDGSCEEKEEIFRVPKLKKEVQSREFVFDNEDVEDQMNFEDFVEMEAEKNGGKGVDCSVAETESSRVKKVSSEEVGLSSSETGDIKSIVISDDSDQVSSLCDGYDEEEEEDEDDDSDDDDNEVGRPESSESMDESSSSYAEDDNEEEDAFEEDEVGCREKKKNTIKPPLKKKKISAEKKEKKLGNPSKEYDNIEVFGDSSSDSEIEIMVPGITRSNGVDNRRDVKTKNYQKKLNVTSGDEGIDDDDIVVNADENGGKGETSVKLDRDWVDEGDEGERDEGERER